MKTLSLDDVIADLVQLGTQHLDALNKIREAADRIISIIGQTLQPNFKLPCSCELFPSGEFVRNYGEKSFTLVRGQQHSRNQMLLFCILLKDGFMDELMKQLRTETETFQAGSTQIVEVLAK